MPLNPAEKFWSLVRRGDECWLWSGNVNPDGYGYFRYGSRTDNTRRHVRAHRFAYELTHGDIPPKMEICHHCDTPLCVRPEHLFVGTRQDNVRDCQSKGRTTKGERSASAKLTAEKVIQLRRLYSEGVNRQTLSEIFGISKAQIYKIATYQCWVDVGS